MRKSQLALYSCTCRVLVVSTDTKQTQLQGIRFKFITTEVCMGQWRNPAARKVFQGQNHKLGTLQVLEYSASRDQSCTSCGITSKKNVWRKRLCVCYMYLRWCLAGCLCDRKLILKCIVIPSYTWAKQVISLSSQSCHIDNAHQWHSEPTTYPGRTYTLTDNEMDRATQALQDHK